MSWHRPYIQEFFDANYDYRNPKRPFLLDHRVEAYRKYIGWQIHCFHYYYTKQQCEEEGKVGLAFDIRLPYCLTVSGNKENPDRDLFANPENVHILLERERFPLIVASAVIGSTACTKPASVTKCDYGDVAKVMRNWSLLLEPGGLLVAAIIDAKIAHLNGVKLLESVPFLTHAWGPGQFESMVDTYLHDVYEVVTLDDMKNFYTFSAVLRKQ